MRILVAGATGAVGRPLLRRLLEAGHEVLGTSRSQSGAQVVHGLGAEPVVCDALDREAVRRAVTEARPEVIVNQLTALSAPINPRKYIEWLAPTNRLRTEGTRHLADAAREAGTRLLVSQSIAFAYRWEGDGPSDESELLFDDAPGGFDRAVAALRVLEDTTLRTPEFEGVVLRYGYFYGPGTSYARDGDIARMVRRRQFPIVGRGTGRFSFVHVEDAAAATAAAIEGERRGVFNVVDDDPAPMREWLPVYAEALGARLPWRVPLPLARLFAGRYVADAAVRMRGASNARARGELGWQPRFPSWRHGFGEALG